MSNGSQAPADSTGALMKAWTSYKDTPDYLHTLIWASKLQDPAGCLWAGFERGFRSAALGREERDTVVCPYWDAGG